MNPVTENEIIEDIRRERVRQDQKWGEQNHRDGTGVMYVPPSSVFTPGLSYGALARRMKRRVDSDASIGLGQSTWLNILLEEVLEAAASDNVEELDDELTQVAAVVVQWKAAIQRRRDAERGV